VNFREALKHVLRHEGGYVDHPSDPGGETNYGITVRVARASGYHGSMRDIPMSLVQTIYQDQYWRLAGCDALPPALRLMHFDSAVNSGVGRASRWLQAAVGVAVDGQIGPLTMEAVAASNPTHALIRYGSARLDFLAGLKTFDDFGRGWTLRVSDVLRASIGGP
jgi:lysozyme family protein